MAHLKEVVTRINLITATQQITSAMKMIAASRLHKVQQRLLPLRIYTKQCTMLLQAVLHGMDNWHHPLAQTEVEQSTRTLLIVLSTDRGLCGALNKNVIKATNRYIEQHSNQQKFIPIELLVVGKKAHQFFKKLSLPLTDNYVDLLEKNPLQSGAMLADYCIKAYQEARYTKVLLVYNSFKNSIKQEVVISPFLPFSPQDYLNPPLAPSLHYIYEPSPQLLIEQLIPEILKNKMIHTLVESSASEYAARTTTMSKATDNANTFLKSLRIGYNSSRQSLITNALAEITSGVAALES